MSNAARRPSPSAEPSASRRQFVKFCGLSIAALAAPAAASESREHLDPDRVGVLTDLTLCVGCRRCEWACAEANDNPHGALHEYDDTTVFESTRHPTPQQLTVVNRVPADRADREPVHLKIQCMHCEKPACVSACLVGAMTKTPDGPVVYDASKCIGCRYCMVACPFDRLTYEFESSLTPRVRKCDMCRERTSAGGVPACVEICPVEAMTFGPRRELLKIARERIERHPDRYFDHIYGEHEAGGTSSLYLADRPFGELGLPALSPSSPADLTEAIQHGIFWGFASPIALASVLGAVNIFANPARRSKESG